jgi:predicted ATPase
MALGEMAYHLPEVAQRSKQAMEKDQGPTFSFLDEPETSLFPDAVIHVQFDQARM